MGISIKQRSKVKKKQNKDDVWCYDSDITENETIYLESGAPY